MILVSACGGATTNVASPASTPSSDASAQVRVTSFADLEGSIPVGLRVVMDRAEDDSLVAVLLGTHRVQIRAGQAEIAETAASESAIRTIFACGDRWYFVSDTLTSSSDFVGEATPVLPLRVVYGAQAIDATHALAYGADAMAIAQCTAPYAVEPFAIPNVRPSDVQDVALHENLMVAVLRAGALMGSSDRGATWHRVPTPNSYARRVTSDPTQGILVTVEEGLRRVVLHAGELRLSDGVDETALVNSVDEVELTDAEDELLSAIQAQSLAEPQRVLPHGRLLYTPFAFDLPSDRRGVSIADLRRRQIHFEAAEIGPGDLVLRWGSRSVLRETTFEDGDRFYDLSEGHEFDALERQTLNNVKLVRFDVGGRYVLFANPEVAEGKCIEVGGLHLLDAETGNQRAIEYDAPIQASAVEMASGRILLLRASAMREEWSTATATSTSAEPLPDDLQGLDDVWLAPDGTIFGVKRLPGDAGAQLLRVTFPEGVVVVETHAMPSVNAAATFLNARIGATVDLQTGATWTTNNAGATWTPTENRELSEDAPLSPVARKLWRCTESACQLPIQGAVWVDRNDASSEVSHALAMTGRVALTGFPGSADDSIRRPRARLACTWGEPETRETTFAYRGWHSAELEEDARHRVRIGWTSTDRQGFHEHVTPWMNANSLPQSLRHAISEDIAFGQSPLLHAPAADGGDDLLLAENGRLTRTRVAAPADSEQFYMVNYTLDGRFVAFERRAEWTFDTLRFTPERGYFDRERLGPMNGALVSQNGRGLLADHMEWDLDSATQRHTTVALFRADRDGPIPPVHVRIPERVDVCRADAATPDVMHASFGSAWIDGAQAERATMADLTVEFQDGAACIRAADHSTRLFMTSDARGHLVGTDVEFVQDEEETPSRTWRIRTIDCEMRYVQE